MTPPQKANPLQLGLQATRLGESRGLLSDVSYVSSVLLYSTYLGKYIYDSKEFISQPRFWLVSRNPTVFHCRKKKEKITYV
jgi:hypothetical protein